MLNIDNMARRYITIETQTSIDRYVLKSDTGQTVRVRKGLYRTDEEYMVKTRGKFEESVYYSLGNTQPQGPGILIESKITMALCRLMQTNNQKAGIIKGFNMKYLTYGLIAFAVIIGLAGGLLGL